jgi:hypothetical protein
MRPVIYIFLLLLPFMSQGQAIFTLQQNAIDEVLRQSFGHAWGDFNNTGFQDLFICNGPNPNQLFRNNGDGTFTEVSDPELKFSRTGTTTYSASWGDYNNDGYLDLLIVTSGQNILLENDKTGGFTRITNTPITNQFKFSHSPSVSTSWVDVNKNGWLDALEVTTHLSKTILLYTSDLNGNFTISQVPNTTSNLKTATWSDFDNNGYPDLFISAEQNKNLLFTNANGVLTEATNLEPILAATDHISASWGDYNNDGLMDLFITVKGSASPNQLYKNVNGVLQRVMEAPFTTDMADSRGSCWGDFNNDGFLDLYVANAAGENFLYQNNGDGTFTKRTDAESASIRIVGLSSSCSFVDYDGDGQLDLFVTNSDGTKNNSLFKNNGNTNKWISVKLVGTAAPGNMLPATNVAAIGAKIYTWATINGQKVMQFREINGQSAYATQSGLFAHFGLGNASSVDSIRIEWPSGIVQRYKNMEVNQNMVITEIQPPATPATLTASATSHNSILLGWSDPLPTEGAFIIERSINDNTSFEKVGEASWDAISYNDEGLLPATLYHYRIKAKNPSGESLYSPEANATTEEIPIPAPSDLQAIDVSALAVQLTWIDNSDNETGFVLERHKAGLPPVIINVDPDVTEYTDTHEIEEETQYTYKIKAMDGEMSSAYSNELIVTTPPFIFPPDDFVAVAASHNQINLSWTDNSDNETGFQIHRSVDPGEGFDLIHTTVAGATSYFNQNLEQNTSYFYKIRAINATHASKFTEMVNVFTLEYNPLTLILPSDIYTEPGTEISIPITVMNFKDVLAAQFTLTWDPAVLSYVSTSDPAFPGMEFNSPAPGGMIFVWEDLGGVAQSLPDNTVLFNVRLQVTGANGESSVLDIPASPAGFTDLVFGDYYGQAIDVQVNPGNVIVQSQVTLAGTITNNKGDKIKGLAIAMTGDDNETLLSTDGTYSFQTRPGNAVEISMYKNNDVIVNNGITTLDIALIRRHILKLMEITNDPYRLIAADVNRDGKVDVNDVAQIRRVVLAMQHTFLDKDLDGRLWRFVPKDFNFSNPSNPFPFDEKISISSAVENQNLDFIGIKLGDVNYSWDNTKARKKSGATVDFIMPEIELEDQDVISLPIKTMNFNNLAAFQFTISWDAAKLDFIKVDNNPLQAHFGQHKANEGSLTVAWDDPTGKSRSVSDSSEIIILSFRVLSKENNDVKITSNLTWGVAYDGDLNEVEIRTVNARLTAFRFPEPDEQPLRIYQNFPNPFGADGTNLRFNLATEGYVKIRITNTMGKIVASFEGYYPAGNHNITWTPDHHLPGGIYLYKLESDNQKLSGKMSLVR